MPLLKDGKLAEDPWHKIVNGEALPSDGPVVVPFERWRVDRDKLLGRNTPLGVSLANTQSLAELASDIERLELIVLEFPKFVDGRAYSQARLLRERYGYRHELRATGNVLRDELQFMQRCGFDAFEIDDPKALESWQAAIKEIDVFYQPASDNRATVRDLRRSATKRGDSTP